MKNLMIIIVLLTCYQQFVNAQKVPEFETTFYFEDAKGNRDSVIIGYDPSVPEYIGGINGLTPQFGEQPLQEPFDTILDVRVDPEGNAGGDPFGWFKRMIGFCEKFPPGVCYGGTVGGFVISNKYPPLKISYSQKAFGTPNLGGSFLTHDKFYDLIGASALPYNHYFCLSDTGEHIIDFSDSSYVNGYWGLFKQNVPMKGGDVANLAQINFYLLVGDCLYHTATSEVKSALLKAYPVPATDRIVIELPEELLFSYKELAVSDVVGRTSMLKLIEEADTTIGLDISSLSPGFYFGRIDKYVFKFVKQ